MTTIHVARPAQIAMLSGLNRTPRHQLVAGMGTGKTGAALLRAGAVELSTGKWPGMLIIAPLQVCFSWVREIPAWRPDLRVSLIAGTADNRKAALLKDADIYIISYDNLPWLHKEVPGSWTRFGAMCVCDESTRLRGTRASWQTSPLGKRYLVTKGGVQTNALATHAADFTYWVNATGTPCPNGAENWWPQLWYVDGGRRLGNSYTSFEERWFYRPSYGGDYAKLTPFPHSVAEITDAIRDVVTVVRTEDYYSLDEPNTVDRYVELPSKARRVYNDMRNKMVAKLDEELAAATTQEERFVAVQSAGAKVAKLAQIAAGWVYWRDEENTPDVRDCEPLHNAKVDEVESILTETSEPLVIFYHYQATVDALKKRFGSRLRELDSAGVAQTDWNAGKVEILACQYQRGGMGLNLQHGGRNICFIEPTYRADDYEQAIERLGPMRQMQAGYSRTVNVFRIKAVNTVDSDIYEKLAGKINLQDHMVAILRAK